MSTTDTSIRLGATVRDLATNFTGIVESRVDQMNGNVQYSVQPKIGDGMKSGEYPSGMSIDVHMLEFIDAGLSDRVTAPGHITIQLGDKVKDIVTGMNGVAISRVTFMNGCIYYNVQEPQNMDKQTGITTVPDPVFLMQARLEVLKPEVAKVPVSAPTTGGRVPGGPPSRAQRQS